MEDFNAKAASWDEDPAKQKRASVIAGEIRKKIHLSKESKAMEYGSGTGLLSFNLKDDLGYIVLADSAEVMLDVADRKIKEQGVENMETLYIDLLQKSIYDHTFDLIYTMMALHHIADTEKIIKTFYEILNPGGQLVIIDLDSEDGSFHGDGFDGHNGFNRDELQKTLEKCGFMKIKSWDSTKMNKEKDGITKTYSLFMMSGEKSIS